jgi:arylsulfatase A-like enzyme
MARITRRGLLAAAFPLLAACAPQEPLPPSLVLLSVDTLTPGALATREVEHLELDRLAERSARFANALSTASWTLPAHASLMTGLYPDRHGATDARSAIAPELPRLAALLRAAGYRTVAFADRVFLEPEFGFGVGFELYDGVPAPDARIAVPRLPRGGRPNPTKGATLFDRAEAYLRAWDEQRPLLLFLHTYSVHHYFLARPWVEAALPPQAVRGRREYFECVIGAWTCPEDVWQELEAMYRQEIAHLDRGVDRLVEALDDAGLLDSSYVVLLSDHGEGFDPRRGRIHHGGRLHADQLRVPLWIAGPGVAPGERTIAVSLVDLLPTLLELLGLPAPEGLDGVSLAEVVRGSEPGEALRSRALFAMEHYHFWEGRRRNVEALREDALAVAVVRGSRWYIRGPESEELYDVAADPRQRIDLAPHSEETAGLRALAATRGRVRTGRAARELPPQLLDELRSLGYVR